MKLTKEKKLKLKEKALRKWERIVKQLRAVNEVVGAECGYCNIYCQNCLKCPIMKACHKSASDCGGSAYWAELGAEHILKAIRKNVKLTRSRQK